MGDKQSNARQIPVQYDERGNPNWIASMSPPDNSFGRCYMVPDRIIPVIFVPGVMGSNLIGNDKDNNGKTWLLDSNGSMAIWLSRGPKSRKKILRPEAMDVYDGGKLPAGTGLPNEELKRRKWGEVGAMSYAEFLVWLENALNDFDDTKNGLRMQLMDMDLGAATGEHPPTLAEIGLSYRYRFPVYACGYNWLGSNADSAKRLGQRIDEVIARYRREKKKVEKVIIVTHSMGGLVARHCSEAHGYSDKILGIVHGVMPAIGAAAVYRRFKSGTEGDYITSEVLGNDAAEMTAVLSSAPGPMQLLPTPEYGNGWLKIRDGGKEYSFPQNGDPYGEIYAVRDKWWSMCDDELMNPMNSARDPKKKQANMDADWKKYAITILRDVKGFHEEIRNRYHVMTYAFYGSHVDHPAYGTVSWQRVAGPGVLRNRRETNVLNGYPVDPEEIKRQRTVRAPFVDDGNFARSEYQIYSISEPDEDGDGTVPHRSGVSPEVHCKSFLQVNVEHEPAYKVSNGPDNRRACLFTLRAIVKIAQGIQHTSLRYD
jgi:pimeloyl-ACP methyl ester carboxylesterase